MVAKKTIRFPPAFIYNATAKNRNKHRSKRAVVGDGAIGMGNEVRQYCTSRMKRRKLDLAGLYRKRKHFYLYIHVYEPGE
jgi:hypothetical protein